MASQYKEKSVIANIYYQDWEGINPSQLITNGQSGAPLVGTYRFIIGLPGQHINERLESSQLEDIFRRMNVVNGDELPVALNHRSLSVGDVVVFDDESIHLFDVWVCRNVGWEAMPLYRATFIDRPVSVTIKESSVEIVR